MFKSDAAPRAGTREDAGGHGPEAGPLDGTYAVEPGNPENVVGYRVTEQLVVNVVETDATGRTERRDGHAHDQRQHGEDADVTANLQTLKLRHRTGATPRSSDCGLQSNQFPEAKFVLTEPDHVR